MPLSFQSNALVGRVAELGSLGGITRHHTFMPYFEIEFIDGKRTTVEADVYPERRDDDDWVFQRDGRIVAQYQSREVRGVRELPGIVRTRGGGRSY